ncbi:hypothetical protein DPMN_032901 [Dreissena polymorpha]|uniref:G-protein coupled receptors family 1 profile domain-containing protein n=2 Tax=Dreissena polymorpha TaxID=45954 RepID=A0A9D4RKJ2_DREPO|nr:hypothetical protein DPMN_032901 [Dreissena polymorpha]
MCGVAISLFLVAWTPYAAVCLWSLFGDVSSIPSQILVVPSMFAKSSACYNPVVYALVNKRYRLAMKKLVGLKKSRRPSFVLHLYNFDQH